MTALERPSETSTGARWIARARPDACLELAHGAPEPGSAPVLAATLGAWDRAPEAVLWPRRPGAVFAIAASAASDEAEAGLPEAAPRRCLLCAGYLPCGSCAACLTGLHLACLEPARPGWNRPGGLATLAAPSAWQVPVELRPRELPGALALLAAAGASYQAVASAGMVPGDAVVVVGDPGPGALPIRLLLAAGLQVLELVDPAGSPRPVPPGGLRAAELVPSELPSARCHLLDLAPSEASLARWLPIASQLQTATLCGLAPAPLAADLRSALSGQCTLRWIRDLHPHLALDLCAFVATGRLTFDPELEVVDSLEAILDPVERWLRGEAERWPVFSRLPRH